MGHSDRDCSDAYQGLNDDDFFRSLGIVPAICEAAGSSTTDCDNGFLRSQGIAPRHYDFSQHSMKEFEAFVEDCLVPLEEKIEAINKYSSFAKRNDILRPIFTKDFDYHVMLRAIKTSKGTNSDNDRSRAKYFVKSAYWTPTDAHKYVELVAELVR